MRIPLPNLAHELDELHRATAVIVAPAHTPGEQFVSAKQVKLAAGLLIFGQHDQFRGRPNHTAILLDCDWTFFVHEQNDGTAGKMSNRPGNAG